MEKIIKYFLLSFTVIFFSNNILFAEYSKDIATVPSQDNTQEFVKNDISVDFFLPRTHLSTSKVKRHGDNIERRDRDDDEDEICVHSSQEDALLADWSHWKAKDIVFIKDFQNDLDKGMFHPFHVKDRYLFICSFRI